MLRDRTGHVVGPPGLDLQAHLLQDQRKEARPCERLQSSSVLKNGLFIKVRNARETVVGWAVHSRRIRLNAQLTLAQAVLSRNTFNHPPPELKFTQTFQCQDGSSCRPKRA